MSAVREERYILADVERNSNKFWSVELHDNEDVITRWGRVGETGQSKAFPGAGAGLLELKTREKRQKGYVPVRAIDGIAGSTRPVLNDNLLTLARDQIRTRDTEATQLIERLAKANIHQILGATTMSYDASEGIFKTPLGVVTQEAIHEARHLLMDISVFVAAQQYDIGMSQVVSQYLMLIPQNIGRSRIVLNSLYPNLEAVQQQNSLLDSLEASLNQVLKAPKSDSGNDCKLLLPKIFDLNLHRVEKGRVIDRLRRKYKDTLQRGHACAHLDVKSVFEVENPPMQQAFDSYGRGLGEVWELWHGTKIANLLSIMKDGLKVTPPHSANITGKMFGPGVYASDQSTKSLNYAYGYWDGSRSENCFMFVVVMAMGKYFIPTGPDKSLPMRGYDSTYAVGGKSSVANNEMIVYRNDQCNLKYLVEFSPKGR